MFTFYLLGLIRFDVEFYTLGFSDSFLKLRIIYIKILFISFKSRITITNCNDLLEVCYRALPQLTNKFFIPLMFRELLMKFNMLPEDVKANFKLSKEVAKYD